MDKHIPIISIDEVVSDKIVIDKKNNIYEELKYNLNSIYNYIPLTIVIKQVVVIFKNNNIVTNNLKLVNLVNTINSKLNQEFNTENYKNNDIIKLSFIKSISKAYLHPSKKSNKQNILVKSKEDLLTNFKDFYPYATNFNSKVLVTANLILRPYYISSKNISGLGIYDAEFSYQYNSKNILSENISYQKTINMDSISL